MHMMACLAARTGRHRQRYMDQFRLVAGCIPYKFDKNCKNQDSSSTDHVENSRVLVLMISTPNRDDLVFPKGGWEDDETVDEAASREAMEEAGILGILSENPLGVWEFRSKSSQNSCSKGRGCRGYMFSLEVTEELDHWPGQTSYSRKWVTIEEAYELCRYDWMRDALEKFVAALTYGTREHQDQLAGVHVSDIGAETEMVSKGYFGNNSSGVQQHLEESSTKCIIHG